eukprot:GHUV01042459.1.p1 GENE.GHUV01042459.1~~GHUV01042459.1.p1  ORF type:complete len:228 (+),score=56.19 GHUV01042459.1:240-923(+)
MPLMAWVLCICWHPSTADTSIRDGSQDNAVMSVFGVQQLLAMLQATTALQQRRWFCACRLLLVLLSGKVESFKLSGVGAALQVVQQEKAAIQPPRLGKEKFEAPAPAVLTSDELTGSLRQLKPCFLVTADRFKALQKRGLIEPRKPANKKQGKKVEYVTGERREKAEERQQEIVELKTARKKAAKALAKGSSAGVVVAGLGGEPRKQLGKSGIDPAMVMPLEVGEGW